MKGLKKKLALALTLCLTLSLLTPLGALAATKRTNAGFSDITDDETAVSVEVLRMLGAVDGYGDGTFRPNTPLTRAQFCKMAVLAQNRGDQANQYKNYTIFPDVKSSHWASGFINLAVKGEQTAPAGGTDDKTTPVQRGIISGFSDGYFYPDRTITYAQAVTILVRMLGYDDASVGGVWPDGHLSVANTSGLTTGITAETNAPVTRGMAARLFASLLATNMKDSATSYGATKVGKGVTGVVLLSSNATAADGSANALKLSDKQVYKVARNAGSGALNGRKGTLLLDSSNNALTFVPDKASKTVTITVALAKSNVLMDSQGKTYEIGKEASAYFNGTLNSYSELYTYITGSRVTLLYNAAGQVDYVFAGGDDSVEAVVVSDRGSVASFEYLAGGYGYKIFKNGLPATSGDMRQYDVAVYSALQNAILVTDTKITGILEDAYPNLTAPTKITVMGHEFPVLANAANDFAKIKAGDQITLLLTDDNKVAGVVLPTSTQTRGNAIGIVTECSGTSATVTLLNGLVLKGNPGLSGDEAANMKGQLVRVASDRKGMLYMTKLLGGNSYPNLDLSTKKLGTREIAENVLVYEQVGLGELNAISLSSLPQTTLGGGRIVYAGYDWANRVNLLILNNASGNGYLYGRVSYTAGETTQVPITDVNDKEPDDPDWIPSYRPQTSPGTMTVTYGDGKSRSIQSNSTFTTGTYAGVSFSGDGKIAGYVELTKLPDVSNKVWSTNLVNVNGATYTISPDVVCYNKATGKWITVGAARAWAGSANLYYDKSPGEGGQIRVIEVS